MGLSNKLFCEAGSFSCCPSTPTGVFIQRFEALFPPTLEPWVAWSASLPRCSSGLSMHTCGAIESASHHLVGSACCSLACPVPQSSTSLGLPATLSRVLSTPAAHLCPSYQSDECCFFISLVVGLPYSSIFCQFWLFFVFKLLLSFFWLCEEAQCVYLCLHLGQTLHIAFFFNLQNFYAF